MSRQADNPKPRTVDVRPFPADRRVVTHALRAGRRMTPIHGLLTADVTEARRLLAEQGLSFTAFVVASVARAAAAHPEVHAYRDWRGRLVVHRYVDVAVLVEVPAPGGSFPLAHLLQDADTRDVADLSAEIRRVKSDPEVSRSGRLLARTSPVVARVPGAVSLMYLAMARSVRARRLAGTVSVSSVGMFAGGDGFGIGFPTVLTLGVLVGGMSERPRVVDGRVEPREVVDLTVTVDHRVVDGGPAARFVADLREVLESAKLLR